VLLNGGEDIVNTETTAATVMSELSLGDVFSFDDLVGAVQRRRQRPIRIVELADLNERDGICALWLVAETEDLVLHARSESTLHRQQFVLHELAHMILGHGDDERLDTPDILLPDIPRTTRRRLLSRKDLDTVDEIAAEYLADHLAAAIRRSALHQSIFLEVFG
jgi:IrrE N-terminal-like domain